MSVTVPRVRPAVAADVAIIAGFNRAMALETEARRLAPETVEAGVARVLREPALGHYYVAEAASEPDGQDAATRPRVIACLLVTFEWSDWRNGLFWWIQSVYVQPEARRQGVFRALHRTVREAALASGEACGLRLYVERDNLTAQRTYAELGMHESGYALFEETFGADRRGG